MAAQPSSQSAGSPALCRAIEKTIRGCGFSTGHCQAMTVPGFARTFNVNAVNAATGESFTVMAPTEQAAWIELARQVGIELED